jgi:hypothetical protein
VKRPLYFRLLRVRHLKARPWAVFLLFEGSIGLGVLLALAEIVSWWGVLAVPVAIAAMVKVNDVLAGALREPLADAQLRTPRLVARRASGLAGVPSTSRPTAPIDDDDAVADPAAMPDRPEPARGPAEPTLYRGAAAPRRPQPGIRSPEPPMPEHADVETVASPAAKVVFTRTETVGRRNIGRFPG